MLHFDTGTNEISDIFLFVFKHRFDIKEKVASKFKEFKSQFMSKKFILVCTYPTFRELENPKITFVIDRDVYYVNTSQNLRTIKPSCCYFKKYSNFDGMSSVMEK